MSPREKRLKRQDNVVYSNDFETLFRIFSKKKISTDFLFVSEVKMI